MLKLLSRTFNNILRTRTEVLPWQSLLDCSIDDMTVSVFIRDGMLLNSELNRALSHTGDKLQLWSQLDNYILARYVIGEVASISCLSRSKMIASTLEELECTTEKQRHTINFLAEQLKLAFALPKGRRYSLDMLICAFTLYHKSPACYLQILKLLCLPSVSLLRVCKS